MADLDLKFGVLGGPGLEAESGREILDTLNSICKKINDENRLNVKIGLDNGGNDLVASIQSAVGNSTYQVNLDIDRTYLTNQLDQFFQNYRYQNNGGGGNNNPPSNPPNNPPNNRNRLTQEQRDAVTNARKYAVEVTKLQGELDRLSGSASGSTQEKRQALEDDLRITQNLLDTNMQIVDSIQDANLRIREQSRIYQAQADAQRKQNTKTGGSHDAHTEDYVANFLSNEELTAQVQAAENTIDSLYSTLNTLGDAPGLVDLRNRVDAVSQSIARLAHENLPNGGTGGIEIIDDNERVHVQQMISDVEELQKTILKLYSSTRNPAIEKYAKAYKNIADYAEKYGNAIRANSPALYQDLQNYLSSAESASFANGPEALEAAFNRLRTTVTRSGADVSTFGQQLKKIFGEKYIYGAIAAIASAVRSIFPLLWRNIQDIDSAMTQLSIVTGQVGDRLHDSFDRAATSAKNLGSTISDLMGAMETFARLGYNMDDSQALAEIATMMSNVAAVSVDEATVGMTSIIKGFNMQVSDAEHIGDVLSNIGKKYAISAGELMEAFQRSSAAFNASNTTFEEATAILAAAQASVQDASTIGTALKTISARIRGSKSELQELGEEYDDVAEGISKYRDEIMALTNIDGTGGFDIMEDAATGTYKSIYDIFVGLASNWDQLSDTSQARVAEIIGGTRQLQVITSIMQNIGDATAAYADSLSSLGSLSADNTVWMESYAGKIGKLKAAFQEFSHLIASGTGLKNLISFGTSFIEILSSIQEHFDLFPIATAIPIIKSITKQIDTLRESSQEASTSWQLLRSVFSKPGLTGPLNWVMLVVEALFLINSAIEAITGKDLVGWFKEWTMPTEERIASLKEEIKELVSTIDETANKLRSLTNFKDTTIQDYLSLYEKAGEFGTQGDLSDEEYERFLSLQNDIAEMLPDLSVGIDSNGNHMLALAGDIDKVTESLHAMIAAEKEAAQIEMLDAYKDQAENIEKTRSKVEQDIEAHKEDIAKLEALRDAYTSGVEVVSGEIMYRGEDGNLTSDKSVFLSRLPDFHNLVGSGFEMPEGVEFSAEMFALNNSLRFGDLTDEEIEAIISTMEGYFDQLILEQEVLIAEYNQDLANALEGMDSVPAAMVRTVDGYDELDSAQKTLAERIAGAMGMNSIIEQTGSAEYEDLLNYLEQNIIGVLEALNLETYGTMLDAGDASIDVVHSILLTKINSMGPEFQEALRKAFGVDANKDIAHALLDMIAPVEKAVEKIGGEDSTAALRSALEETRTDFEKLQVVVDTFNTTDFSSLTKEDFTDLLELLPELRVELQGYNDAIAAGASPLIEQEKLYKKIQVAANKFLKTGLEDAFADIAEAAEEYGEESYEVQTAIRQLSQIAPELAEAFWDEEKSIYAVGAAAGSSAEAVAEFARSSLAISLAKVREELAQTSSQYMLLGASAKFASLAAGDAIKTTVGGEKIVLDQYGRPTSATTQDLETAELFEYQNYLENLSDIVSNLNFSTSSGGGSSETPADKIKESFDAASGALEYHISLMEQYFEQSKKSLDSVGMREALARQVGYYKEIESQADKALDAVKEYYRSTGMSEAQIDQQDEVQDLSQAWLDATQNVSDAIDRMTDAIVEAFSTAVDEIQGVYDTLHSAADEYAKSGFITVDTLQQIISHGVEYLALLKDENGQLVINEERINQVIAARTQQMAVESALSYIEAIRAAQTSGSIDDLNRLLYATNSATQETWGFVYANLALLGLEGDAYQAALNNINALRALADSAVQSIGESSDALYNSLTDMKSGLDDILKYVMDMLKDRIEQQVEALEDQKDAYSDIIDLQKEALENAEDERDYEEEKADLIKRIADLQSRMDSLSLVGTRESESQKAALAEEQLELQKELASLQGDYILDAQTEALDRMEEAYHEEKDDEIDKLEKTISSTQKLYDMAIDYIESNWSTLLDELISWNYEIGSSLESELVSAWENALAAAQRYGSYTQALASIDGDIEAANTAGSNLSIGKTEYDSSSTKEENIRAIVSRMQYNSKNWFGYGSSGKNSAATENKRLAAQLAQFGVNAVIGKDGVWYVDYIGGEQLYKKYGTYHTGGVVGGGPVDEDEEFALLEKGEWVLTKRMAQNLSQGMSVLGKLDTIAKNIFGEGSAILGSGIQNLISKADASTDAVRKRKEPIGEGIHFGDVYIYGASNETVKQHQEINRQFTNEVLKYLNIRK